MTYWKVDPSGLASLLGRVGSQYESLVAWRVGEEAAGAVQALSWGGAVTSEVRRGLSAVFQGLSSGDIPVVHHHIQAGILGVGNAARCYRLGQREMADNFEVQMSRSAISGNFKYFEVHGFKGR